MAVRNGRPGRGCLIKCIGRRDAIVEGANRYSKLRLTKTVTAGWPAGLAPLTRARGLNLDIDGWLRRIGLEQYATDVSRQCDSMLTCFVISPTITCASLAYRLGARLKLLRAVAGTSEQPPRFSGR